MRAAQKISFVYSSKDIPRQSDDVLTKTLEIRPGHQMLTLQRMNYCGADLNEGKHDAQKRLESAQQALTAPKTVTLAAAIQLHNFALGGFSHCNAFSVKDLNDLNRTALHDSSRHQSRRTTEYIHYALAQRPSAAASPPPCENTLNRRWRWRPTRKRPFLSPTPIYWMTICRQRVTICAAAWPSR